MQNLTQMDQRPNGREKSNTTLKGNHREKIRHWTWQCFLRYNTKKLEIKENINKQDYIKNLKLLHVREETKHKMEDTIWNYIYVYISYKGLL